MSKPAPFAMAPDKIDVRPPLALIAGPTASGKSDLAVRLALRLRDGGGAAGGRDAVIINADSAQVYADLRILTARPTPNDMRDVPHRLYGTCDGAVACSAADWAAMARAEIERAHAEGMVPIVVGGTGLYIRTLLDGIAPIPAIDPVVRSAVRALPISDAYAALAREDPERAARLARGDAARICRALEVIRSTGRPLAAWQAERTGGIGRSITLHALILSPRRDTLYPRCDARFAAMLDDGAIAEVERLLSRRLSSSLPVMCAIGVREIACYLEGSATLPQTLELGARATRQYAKRQATWFRNQWPDAPTVDPTTDDAMTVFDRLFRENGLS